MSDYNIYPAVDDLKRFPPSVRAALTAAAELLAKFVHLDGSGNMVVDGVKAEPTPQATLNVAGWARAVFIPNGGTVPGGIDLYTIVVEQE